jgi:hypothetical protein
MMIVSGELPFSILARPTGKIYVRSLDSIWALEVHKTLFYGVQ